MYVIGIVTSSFVVLECPLLEVSLYMTSRQKSLVTQLHLDVIMIAGFCVCVCITCVCVYTCNVSYEQWLALYE